MGLADTFLNDDLYERIVAAVLAAEPDIATGEIDRNAIVTALALKAGVYPARIAALNDASIKIDDDLPEWSEIADRLGEVGEIDLTISKSDLDDLKKSFEVPNLT